MVHPIALALSIGVGLGAVIYALYLSSTSSVPEEPMRRRQPPRQWSYEPEDEDKCSICLSELLGNDARNVEDLNCGHRFHTECIERNRRFNGSICPNCRRRQ